MVMRWMIAIAVGFTCSAVRAQYPATNPPQLPNVASNSITDLQNGVRAARQKRYNVAVAALTAAVNETSQPNQLVTALIERGVVYCDLRQYEKGKADFDAAIRVAPRSPGVYLTAGANAFRAARDADALEYYRAGIRQSHHDPPLLNNFAWFRATCPNAGYRHAKEALAFATEACERTQWRNPHYVDTLAAAEAEAGMFGAAVEHEQQAIRSGKLGSGVEEQLREYRRNQPHHDRPKD